MEILLIHPGALGDILLSLPAIDLLRTRYPGARVTLAGNLDHITVLLQGHVENVVSLSTLPLHRLYAAGAGSSRDSGFWNSFDLIISWTGAGDPDFIHNLKQLHPEAFVASWRPGREEKRHVSQIFADSLAPLIPAGAKVKPVRLALDAEWRRQGMRWLAGRGWDHGRSIAALHPGAGSESKRWPAENFANLARRLTDQQRRTALIIEGPAEAGLAEYIVGSLADTDALIASSLPLPVIAGILAKCDFFVGNDSGIPHLSAALGVRSIVLFGPTLPQHWAPMGEHVTVLRDTDGCDACGSGAGSHVCLGNLAVEDVIRTLGSW